MTKITTDCRLALLSVNNVITSLVPYLPSCFLSVLDKKVWTFSCCHVNHPYFTRSPALLWGRSLSLPVLFPQEKVLYSQRQGSRQSWWRVLLSLQCVGRLSLKIKFHLFVWYKEKINDDTVLTVEILSDNILTDSQDLFEKHYNHRSTESWRLIGLQSSANVVFCHLGIKKPPLKLWWLLLKLSSGKHTYKDIHADMKQKSYKNLRVTLCTGHRPILPSFVWIPLLDWEGTESLREKHNLLWAHGQSLETTGLEHRPPLPAEAHCTMTRVALRLIAWPRALSKVERWAVDNTSKTTGVNWNSFGQTRTYGHSNHTKTQKVSWPDALSLLLPLLPQMVRISHLTVRWEKKGNKENVSLQ